MNLQKVWRRITTTRLTRALEGEILPHLRAQNGEVTRLHSELNREREENTRLRDENRALRTYIFGTASIPPVALASPVGAQHVAPAADARRAESHSPGASSARVVVPNSAAGLADGGEGSAFLRAEPMRCALGSELGASAPSGAACCAPTKNARDAASHENAPHIIAPMRRRSWHQVHRALELAAVRKKQRPDEPLT
jgi:hypothetical protein